MFPTSLLDNIIVLKSFTADLPADFTGGIVDITTKDFPDEKTMGLSVSAGYNPDMHFNNNYLTYAGGDTHFLGFDDGTRANPTAKHSHIPLYARVVVRTESANGQQLRSILEKLNPNLAAIREKSALDFNLVFNLVNQIAMKNNTIVYTFSLVYRNET